MKCILVPSLSSLLALGEPNQRRSFVGGGGRLYGREGGKGGELTSSSSSSSSVRPRASEPSQAFLFPERRRSTYSPSFSFPSGTPSSPSSSLAPPISSTKTWEKKICGLPRGEATSSTAAAAAWGGQQGEEGNPTHGLLFFVGRKKPRQKKGDWRTSGGRGIKGGGREKRPTIVSEIPFGPCSAGVSFPLRKEYRYLWGPGDREEETTDGYTLSKDGIDQFRSHTIGK